MRLRKKCPAEFFLSGLKLLTKTVPKIFRNFFSSARTFQIWLYSKHVKGTREKYKLNQITKLIFKIAIGILIPLGEADL